MRYFFGDSQTVAREVIGAGASLYPWMYCALNGFSPPIVKAIGGSMAADVGSQVYPVNPVSGDKSFLMIGTNDRWQYGSSSAALSFFHDVLSALAYWLGGNKLTARSTGWTFTGSWTSTWNAFGAPTTMQTFTNGGTASVCFTGDSFDLGYIVIDTNTSTFSLSVDGVSQGIFACNAPINLITAKGVIWAPTLLRKSGFGPGNHTLTITANTASGFPVSIDWIGRGSSSIPVYLLSAPRSLRAGDDALTTAYNGVVQTVANEAVAKGLAVTYLDTASLIDPTTDLCSDGVHLSNQGHLNVVGLLKANV